MEKRAAIHKLKGKIFVQGYSKTTAGLYRLHGAVFSADETDYADIGKAVLNAFNACQEGIYHHIEWRDGPEKEDEMLTATKCKTWNTLMKTSRSIHISLDDKKIKLLPLRFLGTTGSNRGYDFLEDKTIISSIEPEALGIKVIEAFELCE